MKKILSVIASLCLFSCHPVHAEGFVDMSITQDNLKSTVCSSQYLGHVIPSGKKLSEIKHSLFKGHAISSSDYVVDFIIPIELGGSTTEPGNMELLPISGTNNAGFKAVIAKRLHEEVCDGRMSLRTAQIKMGEDWVKAYWEYFGYNKQLTSLVY